MIDSAFLPPLVRALRDASLVFIGGSFVLEFIKEGLVSNAADVHVFLIITIALCLVTLSLPKPNHS